MSTWLQCNECGWVGSNKSATVPSYKNMLCCSSCASTNVQNYVGERTVEIPVDLLFRLRGGLICGHILKTEVSGSIKNQLEKEINGSLKSLLQFLVDSKIVPDFDPKEGDR